MKREIKRYTNFLLKPFNIQITRRRKAIDPSTSFMKNEEIQNIFFEELTKETISFFNKKLDVFEISKFDFKTEIRRFWNLYSNRPFSENMGGSGFHNAFWIYLTARIIDPSLIVESGVWKGHTTWLLSQACPEAIIFGFDIDLGGVEYKTENIQFLEQDWTDFKFENLDPEKSLIFFDCHVNHAKRIIEASNKGIKHLLFDDNPPVHKLYAYGLPGFPTANMLHLNSLEKPEISWNYLGQEKKYKLDEEEAIKAQKLIKKHEVFPDVGGPTKYGGFSFLTYVML